MPSRAEIITLLLCSALSAIGAFGWFLHQIFSRQSATTTRQLLLFLPTSIFFWSLFQVMAGFQLLGRSAAINNQLKLATGLLQRAAILYAFLLGVHSVVMIKFRLKRRAERQLEWGYHALVLVVSLPGLFLEMSMTEGRGDIYNLTLQLLFVLFLISLRVFFAMERKRRRTISWMVMQRVIGYLTVAFICWLPFTMLRIIAVLSGAKDGSFLTILVSIVEAVNRLWGLFGLLIYCLSLSSFQSFCHRTPCFRFLVGRGSSLTVCLGKKATVGGENRQSLQLNLLQEEAKWSFEKELQHIDFFEVLGAGRMGIVYHGLWRGADVAIKRIHVLPRKSHSDRETYAKAMAKEAEALMSLRHPNIVQFLGAGIFAGELTIISEYCVQGSLHDVMHSSQFVSWSWLDRLSVLIDAAEGLLFLHSTSPQYIHRDIKSSNILVDDQYRGKIADFGTTRLLEVKNNLCVVLPHRGGTEALADALSPTTNRMTTAMDLEAVKVVGGEETDASRQLHGRGSSTEEGERDSTRQSLGEDGAEGPDGRPRLDRRRSRYSMSIVYRMPPAIEEGDEEADGRSTGTGANSELSRRSRSTLGALSYRNSAQSAAGSGSGTRGSSYPRVSNGSTASITRSSSGSGSARGSSQSWSRSSANGPMSYKSMSKSILLPINAACVPLGTGTPRWKAPEMIAASGYFSSKVDVYSFGCVLYEVLSLKAPFAEEASEKQVENMVLAGERPRLDGFAAPAGMTELIQACWSADPDTRPTMAEVCQALFRIEDALNQSSSSSSVVMQAADEESAIDSPTPTPAAAVIARGGGSGGRASDGSGAANALPYAKNDSSLVGSVPYEDIGDAGSMSSDGFEGNRAYADENGMTYFAL